MGIRQFGAQSTNYSIVELAERFGLVLQSLHNLRSEISKYCSRFIALQTKEKIHQHSRFDVLQNNCQKLRCICCALSAMSAIYSNN